MIIWETRFGGRYLHCKWRYGEFAYLDLIIEPPQLFHRVSLGSIDTVLIDRAHPTEFASESQSQRECRAPLHHLEASIVFASSHRTLSEGDLPQKRVLAWLTLIYLCWHHFECGLCCMLHIASCTLHIACASFGAFGLRQAFAAATCDINNLGLLVSILSSKPRNIRIEVAKNPFSRSHQNLRPIEVSSTLGHKSRANILQSCAFPVRKFAFGKL